MTEFFTFVILGCGIGGMYVLFATGLVIIHRGSGVVNFAHGAIGMVGTYAFYSLSVNMGWAFWQALIVGVAVSAAIGAATHFLIMRPLRKAPPVARLIATLGLLTVLEQGMALHYSPTPVVVHSQLPVNPVHVLSAVVGENQIILLAMAVVGVAVLAVVYRYTQFGRATAAVAENPLIASAQGVSSDFVAAVNWAIGGALAGVAGIFLAPIDNLSITGYTLLVVPALAAASLGRINSFPWALAGGLILGIAQSELSLYVTTPGWGDAAPFLLILIALLLRRREHSLRTQAAQRLPRVGSGQIRWPVVVFWLVLSVVFVQLVSAGWTDAVTTTVGTGLVVLSFVVVTGYTGQLSLAQFAFAGFGAWVAGRLVAVTGVPFLVALVVGVLACLPVGLLLGVICLRTRGANLAIATLALAVALESVIFDSFTFTGGIVGTNVGSPEIFGLNMSAVIHSNRYALMTVILFIIAGAAAANFRRGRSGRRALAIRANERAAAAVGINVWAAKLAAFGLGSMIAGLGGVILAFQDPSIEYSNFSSLDSIQVAAQAVIGGVGWIAGAVYGGMFQLGSLANTAISALGSSVGQYLPLAGGVLVVINLVVAPDGLAYVNWKQLRQLADRVRPPRKPAILPVTADPGPASVVARRLEITGLSVNFGGVAALKEVSLTVEPGKVTGLIGPNGAGKTTLIDAATGFVRIAHGQVSLDGQDVTGWTPRRLAEAGLVRSFQSLELFDDLSVLDNLLAASEDHRLTAHVRDVFVPSRAPVTPATVSAIREFDLDDVLAAQPTDLTFGMRRLVAIARAVATSPSVLLLDEPAAGLDESERRELGHLIRRLAGEWGMGVLLVEHDVDLVMRVSDTVYALDFGERIAAGTPGEVRNDKRVIGAYLGEPESIAHEAAPRVAQ